MIFITETVRILYFWTDLTRKKHKILINVRKQCRMPCVALVIEWSSVQLLNQFCRVLGWDLTLIFKGQGHSNPPSSAEQDIGYLRISRT